MKINVTVDLEDFYIDEDSSNLNDEIKKDIANKVKNLVWKQFEENALKSFDNQVKRQIEIDRELKIKQTIDDLFKNKKLKKPYSGNELVSVEDYIIDELNRNIGASNQFDRNIRDLIDKKASEIAKDLKDRYDLLFASQIVSNLNKQGMLKDDIAKILLENNGS